MEKIPDNTFVTNGITYRTPGHPEIISAIGRALWNFLNLEEQVVAILSEGKFMSLEESRKLMAAGKAKKLNKFKNKLLRESAPSELIIALQVAYDEFNYVTQCYRNAISHASPYTARYEDDGTYIPGISLFTNMPVNIESVGVGDIAMEIEKAIDSLSNARTLVFEYSNAK